ncbi:unnamed protein product [Protopolystoma xenopodis]|uniref:Uncharacterized protein n=1 Tax=Protopolystoma xenopodis TaxID=117903 RepID=A0A448WPX8_9PLAT|nr:unnamed protein product [Protopolystoma xenopodis]
MSFGFLCQFFAGWLILLGVFVNGPYALITTAVSADLGTHPTLRSSAKAVATVTAIIDGTGSMGIVEFFPRTTFSTFSTASHRPTDLYASQARSTRCPSGIGIARDNK